MAKKLACTTLQELHNLFNLNKIVTAIMPTRVAITAQDLINLPTHKATARQTYMM